MFQTAVPFGPLGIKENPAGGRSGAFQTGDLQGEEGRPRRISDSIEERGKGSATSGQPPGRRPYCSPNCISLELRSNYKCAPLRNEGKDLSSYGSGGRARLQPGLRQQCQTAHRSSGNSQTTVSLVALGRHVRPGSLADIRERSSDVRVCAHKRTWTVRRAGRC
jgi:hypothetical protein